MPNWCHNTLKVAGPASVIAAFTERAVGGDPLQPFSFAQFVPEPSKEVYTAIEEEQKIICDLCGGTGVRPVNAAEAEQKRARWEPGWERMDFLQKQAALSVAERVACNGCHGEGRWLPFSGGWYGWRLEHWGCKWDASFDGPFMALGAESANVAATVKMQGRVVYPGGAEYRFDTPWGPPLPVVCALSEHYPTLRFTLRYAEPGNGFAGEIIAEDGAITEEELPVEAVLTAEEMWF